MAATIPAIIPVANENEHMSSRITREGRKLTYKLRVIQRPERARACGQGAKSSSDRRPVDPPPIVDLQVYEGEEMRDITFTYNANFFLFATLEEARQKVQGRVPVQSANQPVLTGTPVAGMAYLERPDPAGYFIFPDLSVRHEGHFRLSFTLFEEVKDPKDADNDGPAAEALGIGTAVHGRCEVKSSPFHVYSAKKFPGLTESTALSRQVADQGCRVRIRRDVRMRRRTDKSAKDWDDYEDETAHQRDQRSASPGGHGRPALPSDRARSASNSSTPYQQLQQAPRRPSEQNIHTHYSQSYAHPSEMAVAPHQPEQTLPAPQAHAYAHPAPYQQSPVAPYPGSYHQPFMAPQHIAQAQAPMHQYQAPPYTYGEQQAQPGQVAPQAMPYGYMQQPMYEPQMPHVRHDSMEYMNGGSHATYARGAPQYNSAGQAASPLSSTEGGSMSLGAALPPLQRMDVNKVEQAFERAGPPPPAEYSALSARPMGGAKRSYGSTFSMQHVNEPLRGGARPDVVGGTVQEVSDGSDEDVDWEALKMNYRRADGSRVSRQWPPSAL